MAIIKPSLTRTALRISKNLTAFIVNRHVAALIGVRKAAEIKAIDAQGEENDIYNELCAAELRTAAASANAEAVATAVAAEIELLATGKLDEVTA